MNFSVTIVDPRANNPGINHSFNLIFNLYLSLGFLVTNLSSSSNSDKWVLDGIDALMM